MRYGVRMARRPLRVLSPDNVLHPWVLEQRAVWVDVRGREHRIHEMDIDYVRNVQRFVERRLESYVLLYSGWRPLDDAVLDNVFESGESAMVWLRRKPLMRVLSGRIHYHERQRGIVRDHLMTMDGAAPSLAVALLAPRRDTASTVAA